MKINPHELKLLMWIFSDNLYTVKQYAQKLNIDELEVELIMRELVELDVAKKSMTVPGLYTLNPAKLSYLYPGKLGDGE